MNENSTKAIVLSSLLFATIGCWIACLGFNFEMLYAAVGVTALTIVTVPMIVERRFDWFSPWTFVVLSVAVGCAARGICMSLGWPDAYDIDQFFLLGEDPHFFVRPSLYLLLGLAWGNVKERYPNVRQAKPNKRYNEGRTKK